MRQVAHPVVITTDCNAIVCERMPHVACIRFCTAECRKVRTCVSVCVYVAENKCCRLRNQNIIVAACHSHLEALPARPAAIAFRALLGHSHMLTLFRSVRQAPLHADEGSVVAFLYNRTFLYTR